MSGLLRFLRFFVEGGCLGSRAKTHSSHIPPLYEETKKTKKVFLRRKRRKCFAREENVMYDVVDERLDCGKHGRRARAAIHLNVENGDLNNPEHAWMVCLECAQRLDRDPKCKASKTCG
jgi:hypothetical protein